MNAKKKGLGKGLSALFGDQKKPEKSDKIEDFEKNLKNQKPWIIND